VGHKYRERNDNNCHGLLQCHFEIHTYIHDFQKQEKEAWNSVMQVTWNNYQSLGDWMHQFRASTFSKASILWACHCCL